MDDQPQVGASDLQALAKAKFDKPPLSDSEKLLLEKVVTGGWAYCGPKPKDTGPNDRPPRNDYDPNNNPQEADKWTEKENRQIRAELVAWLCSDQKARERVHPRGIQVYGAVVTGNLNLSLLNIPFQLAFQHCRLNTIHLQQAEVLQLDLQGSLVDEIRADSLIVKANVAFRDGFKANGEVRLPFAQIGGVLDCSGGTFINPAREGNERSGRALNASGIDVKGYVFLSEDFTAEGEVNLANARIGSDLNCSGGTFTNRPKEDLPGSGTALRADGIVIKGDASLRDDFKADGEVNFRGAEIGTTFDCSGGKFTNPRQRDTKNTKNIKGSGSALSAEGMHVKGQAFLRDGFVAEGAVSLYGAQIGGVFQCRKGNFEKATLDLRDTSVASLWDSGLNVPAGEVADHTKWPQSGELHLDGFVYGRISSGISSGDIDASKRLAWLARQPRRPFLRQPYLHLAKVLRDSGDTDGALDVLIKMEELSRSGKEAGGERVSNWLGKIISSIRMIMARRWSLFLKWSIGYGYRPGRAIWLIIFLCALGWTVYDRSYHAGTMVPTDETVYKEFIAPETKQQVPGHYPSFSPVVYSLENSLPLVKLGQSEKWHPVPSRFATSPWFVTCFLYIQILLGWFFATLFVAGVGGFVHKE